MTVVVSYLIDLKHTKSSDIRQRILKTFRTDVEYAVCIINRFPYFVNMYVFRCLLKQSVCYLLTFFLQKIQNTIFVNLLGER